MMIEQDSINNDTDFSRILDKDFTFDVYDTANLIRLPKGKLQVNLSLRSRYSDRRSTKNNFLFISGERSPHELDTAHKYYHIELAPGPQGKDLDLDKEWKTYNRKEVKIMNMYLNILSSEIEYRAKTVDSETTWDMPGFYMTLSEWLNKSGFYKKTFSPYAGCSMCKCSPGFKLKNIHPSIKNVSMHVDFKEIE